MLILSRRMGESLIIRDDIEVKVIGISGDTVSIGISAPREITILRREIFDSVREENRGAGLNIRNRLDDLESALCRRRPGSEGTLSGEKSSVDNRRESE